MQIVIAAVGRARGAPEQVLAERYLSRAEALGARLGLGPCRLAEIEDRRGGRPEDQKAREAALLRSALPAGTPMVALDETGTDWPSVEFANRLARWRDDSHRALGFIIGGADGLDPALRAEAAGCLAFGRMTWPHLLVRAMISEQIYRAISILADHPYHRE